MIVPVETRGVRKACTACRSGAGFDIPISMAFQPIVDMTTDRIFAYEALVRGLNGESAAEILSSVTEETRYAFDQKCRVTAIAMAADLRIAEQGALVSINVLPNAIYEPHACIGATLSVAELTGFPFQSILFEFCESEILDTEHVLHVLRSYDTLGLKTAIDDFGAGYSGLSLLARFQPDYVKIDMSLVRDLDTDPIKQVLLRHIVAMLDNLGVTPICEGIETASEAMTACSIGITLQQGYVYARPALGMLPLLH